MRKTKKRGKEDLTEERNDKSINTTQNQKLRNQSQKAIDGLQRSLIFPLKGNVFVNG